MIVRPAQSTKLVWTIIFIVVAEIVLIAAAIALAVLV